MKNKKKFKKELYELLVNGDKLAVDSNGNPVSCDTITCNDCQLCPTITFCQEKRKEWLEAEYVEPEVDWSTVPIDTKVLVKDFDNDEWTPRYFAGVNKNGQLLAWVNGRTSFTVDPINDIRFNCSTWSYMKLYKEDNKDED